MALILKMNVEEELIILIKIKLITTDKEFNIKIK